MSAKRLLKSQTQAVGPNHVVAADVLVISNLPQHPAKISVGTEKCRIDAEIEALVDSAMRVQSVVTRVAGVRGGQRGKTLIAVFRRYQIGHQQIGQFGAAEGIAQEEGLRSVC